MTIDESKVKKKNRVKVTITLESKLWQEFQIASIIKYGKVKHASKIIENLIKEYLEKERKLSV